MHDTFTKLTFPKKDKKESNIGEFQKNCSMYQIKKKNLSDNIFVFLLKGFLNPSSNSLNNNTIKK